MPDRAGAVGALLADDRVVGARGAQAGDDRRLGGAVVVGDEVGRRRLRRRRHRRAASAGRAGDRRRRPPAATRQRARPSRAGQVVDRRARHRGTSLAPCSRSLISRHSPSARSTSTATMLIPPAATTAPTRMPRPSGEAAVAVALQLDEAVADQPAGEAAEQDADEGGDPGRRRRQRRQRARRSVHEPRLRTGEPSAVRRAAPAVLLGAVRVVAVVPTYNEVDNLEALVRRHPRRPCPASRSLVVDDDSPDGTARPRRAARPTSSAASTCSSIAAQARARVGVPGRVPPGASTRGADVCVQIDADLSHDPADPAGAARQRRARRRPGDRQPLRARRAHRELAVAAALAVAVGQPLRRRRARAGGQRRHGRVPGLPRRRAASGWTSRRSRPRATASRSR